MQYHNILVLEGGGAKGPIHVGELDVLEERTGLPLCEIFDLFATTSIGGVEASIYTTGKMSVERFWGILEPNLKKIFSSRRPWSIPRYDWNAYKSLYLSNLGHIKFGDVKSKLMCTTVNLVDGKTHFLKSWKSEYENMFMVDIIHRTFAAPFFFGGVYDRLERAIWSDGGCGFFNLPLIEAYTQALTLGWLDEGHKCHVLALGTGRKPYALDFIKEFKKGKMRRAFSEIKRFMSKKDGGLARAVSASTQVSMLKKLDRGHDNLSFQWVDWFPMEKKLDKMNNWKARQKYYEGGRSLGRQIDIKPLMRGNK